MVEDVQEEIEELVEEIGNGIKKLSNMKPSDRSELIKGLLGRLKRLDQCISSFDLELREMTITESTPYQAKKGQFTKTYAEFKQQLDEWKKNNDRQLLGLDANLESKPAKTADEIFDEADAIQDKSKNVVARMNQRVEDIQTIGVGIAKTLQEDNEKLRGMQKDFQEMDDGIEQSRKLIRSIMISIQRDRCIKVLVAIVLVGILVVLIWSLVDPNFSVGGGDGKPSGQDRKQ